MGNLYRFGSVQPKHVDPLHNPYTDADEDDLQDLMDDAEDVPTKLALRIEITWRQSQSYVLDKADAAMRKSRIEDLTLELTHPPAVALMHTASRLSRDTKFKVAVAEATAAALRVRAEEDDNHDWIDLLNMYHGACCIKVQLRLHSAADASDDWPPSKPRLMEFERLFLRVLNERVRRLQSSGDGGHAASWPNKTFALLGNLQVRTSPGMPAYGERVEVGCNWGGPAVAAYVEEPVPLYFPTHQDDPHSLQATKGLVGRLRALVGVVDRRRP